ncbi:MAG: ATP-dependent Clp protease proteolytic subunit [Peptostreptococcaceae bacterium]
MNNEFTNNIDDDEDDLIDEVIEAEPIKNDKVDEIKCITIIGEIEGHFVGNPQKKSTKYEQIIPMLYSVEEDEDIKGILIILNTVGGDVEAGLAMGELINSVSKKVVTLVLGGSHSIGVPLSTAGDYSFIAPTATMIVHPIRTNGLVIGVNETFEYFKKMQERITSFIVRTSHIEKEELDKIMHSKDELVSDVGSVLIGKDAVDCGIIDEVGGLKDALKKLKELIKEEDDKKEKEKEEEEKKSSKKEAKKDYKKKESKKKDKDDKKKDESKKKTKK